MSSKSNRIVVVGDALLDRDIEGRVDRLCPDAPVPVLEQTACRTRPGGAGLAASLLAQDGWPVTLITSLSSDAAAGEFARGLVGAGVDLFDLGQDGTMPEKIRLRSSQTLLRLDRGRHGRLTSTGLSPALAAIMSGAAAILVADYGQGITACLEIRETLEQAAQTTPVVWDPHPRGSPPVPGMAIVKPNQSEAERLSGAPDGARSAAAAIAIAQRLRHVWRAESVCMTRGEAPVLLAFADGGQRTIRVAAAQGDVCGAGDRFAASLARELATGSDTAAAAVTAAGDATEFVRGNRGVEAAEPHRGRVLASNPLRAFHEFPDPADEIAAEYTLAAAGERIAAVKATGGMVVATGGCFDLLHSGHVRMLQAAARLGDHLLVLLNSDRSVKSIKGPDRPLVSEQERALLLRSLTCIDQVAIFDEPTPVEALRRLRPDVWAKGGDYEVDQLPERDVIAGWGGRLAILPFVEERSTTRLIKEAGARARA